MWFVDLTILILNNEPELQLCLISKLLVPIRIRMNDLWGVPQGSILDLQTFPALETACAFLKYSCCSTFLVPLQCSFSVQTPASSSIGVKSTNTTLNSVSQVIEIRQLLCQTVILWFYITSHLCVRCLWQRLNILYFLPFRLWPNLQSWISSPHKDPEVLKQTECVK